MISLILLCGASLGTSTPLIPPTPSAPPRPSPVVWRQPGDAHAPDSADAASSAPARVSQEDARLAEARAKLLAKKETVVRAGAKICAQVNNVDAVVLLLSVLEETAGRGSGYLSPPHYRDVAWESLIAITEPYARERVRLELDDKRAAPRLRQWCAEALGIWGAPEYGASLAKALQAKDLDLKRAAARSLGNVHSAAGLKAVKKKIKDKDPMLRANALESVARQDPEGGREALFKALAKDKDAGVRCALLAAACELYPEEAEALCDRAREHDDWRPRMQAVDSLGLIRTKTAVDQLIEALSDGRPVVAERAITALQELTGQKHRRPDAWRAWWRDNRETFVFPEGRQLPSEPGGDTVASYNGIRLVSDHVAFLIDKSAAMGESLSSRGGISKERAAYDELAQVFEKLSGRLVFNLFTYELSVRPFSEKGPVKLGKRTAKQALEFLNKAPLQGRKDIWQVLEMVMADADIDTVYLLSSGEPDVGLYVHWNRITMHLKELNRFRKVVIHTIAYSDSKWFRDQLEKIAEATGGEFTWFD